MLWLAYVGSTYPTGSTARRWARLKDFGRLVSDLWIGRDRRRAEGVRVWIQGHVLLKHKQAGFKTARLSPQSERIKHRTHKVPVHLPHSVSHVDHHVVEHAERIPHRVLENGERKEQPWLGSHAARRRGIISSSTTLSCVQACVHRLHWAKYVLHVSHLGRGHTRMHKMWPSDIHNCIKMAISTISNDIFSFILDVSCRPRQKCNFVASI